MNLVASGSYPFVQFQPTETNGVQHTDQEFTDSNGNSYLFRMYNAEYNSLTSAWQTLPRGGSDAYATVQNPDGSIHYYWNGGSSPWTAWQGSDNNTVYNGVDFGLSAGGSASGNSGALTSVLTAIFNATPVGGGVWIPEFGYQVNSSSSGILVPYNTILQGLGTSGINQSGAAGEFHFSINLTGSGSSGNTFFLLSGAHNSGGTLFQNLGFSWIASTCANDTCINAENGWNLRAANCFFLNCPIVLNCLGLASGLDGSSIKYEAGSPDNAVAVILQSPQCFAAGPGEYAQDAVNPSMGGGSPGPTNCVAVMICGAPSNAEHCWVRDVHLSEFSYGVCFNTQNAWSGTDFCTATLGAGGGPIDSGSQDAVVTNVECQAYVTAVYIQPAVTNNNSIYGVKVSDSYLVKSQNSEDGHAIAYVDTNGGGNANVSDIEFSNCTIFSNVTTSGNHTGVPQNGQYGLQLNAGDNLRVVGGRISNMGTQSTHQNDGTANIAITGAVGTVTIDAVNLSATAAIAAQQRPSQWGLLVTGNITGPITVSNCNFGTTGWGTSGPVSVTGAVSASNPLYVTNCPGYNDQGTSINTLANISTATAYQAANQGAHGGTSYFGPSFVIFTAHAMGGTFQYNGGTAQTLLPSQVVCLTLALPYDTIQFNTHKPAAFAWIGK